MNEQTSQDMQPVAITSTMAADTLYTNRELSWLAFNRRVLAEASRANYPLLERLRFLSISGSNLDEFVMIRVAGLAGQLQRGITKTSIDGRTPSQQLSAIRKAIRELEFRQQSVWRELRGLLSETGIHVCDEHRLDAPARVWLKEYFESHILPVLTPQAIDPAHPFPFVANKGMGLLFNLTRLIDGQGVVEMILIPSAVPRFVRVPGEEATWMPVERLIGRYANLIFPGFRIEGDGVFRVIRDSDIEVEEEAEDLVRYFRSAIQRRRRGQVIMLELDAEFDPEAEKLLREQLGLDNAMVVKTDGIIGIEGLASIVDEDRPDLKFEPYTPRYPERIMEHDGDCFAAIGEKDIVIHHPYESFEVVVDFVRQAAADPDVVAIKQTLYRAGKQSAIINALIAAAEAGKSVTAVVELKARFDEEQNILWANKLERAGVQVIYGFVDWKTHAKVSMVVRREGDGYRTYCHFGTGNYHPVTARIYTDLSYFTADPRLTRDAARLFNFVTGYVEPRRTEGLVISPIAMRETIYANIDREIANHVAGRPAAIWAKLNSLTDKGVIDKLYEAGSAGVPIRLVIRGICCLKPGIPGVSETIEVKSIIGRFLEHSRIWAFSNGFRMPSPRARVFISSADAMSRNLDRRVELMVPIRNRTVHDQVLGQVLVANLLDSEQSWRLKADGAYERVVPGEKPFNLHRYFMTNPSLSGRGQALAEDQIPRLALRRGARKASDS
ncbi:RNA degradosome polyphosphate kinase [Croceicoccus ponticola]|uniref:Polyphosphate kinase n=1 Tax=Croceicoccus ponticola TaxID=2217664 RepID=A0A437H059_9SPHN|nr:RNA degradosome polyphosphate kinase [Croceicoccus ponticola]RVQ68985.1 RNA degradosome polyphosphate kinase [Croceicoccus ponticola]